VSYAAPQTASAHINSTPPYPSCSVSFSYFLTLVLRRSSSKAGAVDLPLVCCRSHALPKLNTHVCLLHSAPATGRRYLTHSPGASPLPTSRHDSCLSMLSCLSRLYICGLGLCPFSELDCDLLLRGSRELSPNCALQELRKRISVTILVSTACRTAGSMVPYLP